MTIPKLETQTDLMFRLERLLNMLEVFMPTGDRKAARAINYERKAIEKLMNELRMKQSKLLEV